jgi:hypothetical protein
VFQLFHLDVACVLFECRKSRSGCCTCSNGYTRMLQVYVPNISAVFKCICKRMFSKCFSCFRSTLQVFHLNIGSVLKVDLNIVYVAMTMLSCFKRILLILQWWRVVVEKMR